MKYILHDTTAIDDDKLGELFINFGYEGIGLFWTILEKIGKQEKPIKTTVLKAQLKVGKKLDKCWNFMESLGLISSNNGETFNERILSYSESYKIKKEKTREKISQWRENQQSTKNVTGYVPICNPPKVKESKVKESKESINTVSFTIEHCKTVALNDQRWVDANKTNDTELKEFNRLLEQRGIYEKNPMDYKTHFANWKRTGKKDIKPESKSDYKDGRELLKKYA